MAVNPGGVITAVLGFVLTRGVLTGLVLGDAALVPRAGSLVFLTAGFGIVLYGVNLAVSTRTNRYARTVGSWSLVGAGLGVLGVAAIFVSSAPGSLTGIDSGVIANSGILGGGMGVFFGIKHAEAERYRSVVDRQIEQGRLLNRLLRHEIRNSLTILRGHTAFVLENPTDGPLESESAISSALDRIERATDETGFLTSVTAGDAEPLRPIRLGDVIEGGSRFNALPSTAIERSTDVAVRADSNLERLLTELAALPTRSADADEAGFDISAADRAVSITVTAPGMWLREREVLLDGVPEYERNDVDYGVPIVRLLTARYAGVVSIESSGDETAVTVRLPRSGTSAARVTEHGFSSGTLWQTLAVGIGAGTAMGLFLQFTTGSLPIIGALYGSPVSSVGWIAHLFHSAVFAVVFAVVQSYSPLPARSGQLRYSVALGLGYGFLLWFLAAGVIMALWLNASGYAVPVPNLDVESLLGHLLWGATVGATAGSGTPARPLEELRSRRSSAAPEPE
ncbi:histidine kinase [Halobaculum gomorrense]|uniref:histidine kinase n=1 Tax=Halobaculum gomorrense TaxID=43928 RepID=UPI0013567270|nr:histidine kinase [Halobaculum gomorrense]